MRYNQAWISRSLVGLTTDYRKKYGWRTYYDSLAPLVFLGMYRDRDFEVFQNHKGKKAVIYCGSDAMNIPDAWLKHLRKSDVNISKSAFITKSLQSKRIKSVYYPVNATIPRQWTNVPSGNKLYWYYSENCPDVYGGDLIESIERISGIEIIKATVKTFDKSELAKVYADCFLNLRLTAHDGCPNTNLQMGLMGRKSIYNGDLPHSIKWGGVDDICRNIETEYLRRDQNNQHISNDFLTFINKYSLYEGMPQMPVH
jgi:hypothetical protein